MAQNPEDPTVKVLRPYREGLSRQDILAELHSWFWGDAEAAFAKAEQAELIKKTGKNDGWGREIWVAA